MKTRCINEPPNSRGLFLFLGISIVHLILLLFIYYDIKYIFLVIIELLFYVYNYKKSIKNIIKVLAISFLIFMMNIFFTEGKIIFQYGIIRITSEGLENSIKRAGILLLLFLFTLNSFKDRKDKILQYYMLNNKNSLIFDSINYFLVFWDLLGEKGSLKRFLAKIINVYKSNRIVQNNVKNVSKLLEFDFYVYQIAFFCFFIIISLYAMRN